MIIYFIAVKNVIILPEGGVCIVSLSPAVFNLRKLVK